MACNVIKIQVSFYETEKKTCPQHKPYHTYEIVCVWSVTQFKSSEEDVFKDKAVLLAIHFS